MDIYNPIQALKDDVGLYQRNITQMTEADKEKYKKPLLRLKKQISRTALIVQENFVFTGCVFNNADEAEKAKCVKKIEGIVQDLIKSGEWSRPFSDVLLKTYDVDAFLRALSPMQHKIYYKGYGEYWLSHCEPTFKPEFPFYNNIFDMYWRKADSIWVDSNIKDGKAGKSYSFAIMLPPTQDLLDEQYESEVST